MAPGDNEFFRDGDPLARALSRTIFALPVIALVVAEVE
jgi:hypothetical protein